MSGTDRSNLLAARAANVIGFLNAGALATIMAGREIAQAKAEIPHGGFKKWVAESLPVGYRRAATLMRIATDPNILRIVGPLPEGHPPDLQMCSPDAPLPLPADGAILDEICGLEPDLFDALVRDGVICPDMKRGDVRAALLDDRDMPALYGVIVADPPWSLDDAGGRVMEKSLEELKALPVADLAADDSCLCVWVDPPFLADAVALIAAWGFTYKTNLFVWRNGDHGTGEWTAEQTRICFFGTRGAPKRKDKGVGEMIEDPETKGGRVPVEGYRRIERLLDGPYLELFAQDRQPGWWAWGK